MIVCRKDWRLPTGEDASQQEPSRAAEPPKHQAGPVFVPQRRPSARAMALIAQPVHA